MQVVLDGHWPDSLVKLIISRCAVIYFHLPLDCEWRWGGEAYDCAVWLGKNV